MFCSHLCAASSGEILPTLFNTAVGRKEGGERSWTSTLPMQSSLNFFFYLPLLGTAVTQWQGDRRRLPG
jgi:hypothetical protein